MAYKKKEPRLLADGTIARVNMIVYDTKSGKIGQIVKIKLSTNNKMFVGKIKDGWRDLIFGPDTYWGFVFIDSRKATPEEKKQYWKKLVDNT